jgi:hypothetical protein
MSKISIMSVTDSLVGERYFIDLPLIAENPKICVESNTEFTSLTRIEIPRLLAKHITDLQSKNDRLQGIINKALRQQPEPDTVRISRECARRTIRRLKLEQENDIFHKDAYQELIDEYEQALENDQ